MTKNILYSLMGSVLSFCIQQKGQATNLDHIIDAPTSYSSSGASKKTIGENHYFLPLGRGEISLFDDYTKHHAKIDIHKIRVVLMPWVYKGMNRLVCESSFAFSMPHELAKGLYQDYKPIYDAFREAYEQDSEKGQDLFVNKAVSQFNIDEAYARTLYDALKPSPSTLVEWQKYKQASSSSSSSSSAAAATPPQETAEEKLKKLLLSNTLNSGSAAAAKTPPLQEEKEQTFEEAPVPPRKPFTGLRHRNLSPPG